MPRASARARRASAISRGGVFQARACAFFQQKCCQPMPSSIGGPPLWPRPIGWASQLASSGAMGAASDPFRSATQQNPRQAPAVSAAAQPRRAQPTQKRAQDALRQEDDEDDEQRAVDDIVPAYRRGAEPDTQALG